MDVPVVFTFPFFRTCWVNQVTGVWVYPVLERITPLARVVFFSVMTMVIGVFYVLGEILNSYIWDQPGNQRRRSRPELQAVDQPDASSSVAVSQSTGALIMLNLNFNNV